MSHQLPPEEIQYELQHIHEDRSSELVTTFATCTALAYIAVILRLIARRVNRAPIQADDSWVLVALVSTQTAILSSFFMQSSLTRIFLCSAF